MRLKWWFLLLAGLMAGCASRPGATTNNGDLKFTNQVDRPGPIEKLSGRIAIRLAAGELPKGMRIAMLTYEEVRKLIEPMVYGKTL